MQITSPSAIAASTAQAQSTADLLPQSSVYTANIAGKTFTADLNLSAGQYVATIPDQVPPITASGSSLILAENNLDARISLLV
jgi:hypothetical protein